MNTATILKRFFVVILFAAIASFIIYQKNKPTPTAINWQTLAQVKFSPTWYAAYKATVDVPVFADTLKKLNGQLVEITGFYIPMTINSDKCALSKNPNSSCFFCGGGTIETIVMVNFKSKVMDFADDEVITIKGKLVLDTSFNNFIYNLTDANYVRSNK
ncbi:MAG: hypothetical protein ABJA37_12930 [Ferruginibacter sp.]